MLLILVYKNDAYIDDCLHSGGDYVIDIAINSVVKCVIKYGSIFMFVLLHVIDTQMQCFAIIKICWFCC